MSNISNERLIATRVLVKFEDGPVSFRVPSGATLADVSEKFDKISRWHKGQALAIELRLALHLIAHAPLQASRSRP
ncbi:MAG: hypothetical protein WBX25_27760 [Rhodomicrobium sp.]